MLLGRQPRDRQRIYSAVRSVPCMKTALFLGAGASVFVGHPTTKELMDLVRERMEKRRNEPHRTGSCQNYIMSVVNSDAYSDVEKLYDGIEQIINVHTSPNCKPIVRGIRDANTDIRCEQIIEELEYLRSIIRDILLESFVMRSDYHEPIKLLYDKIRSAMKIKGSVELQVFTTNYDIVMEEYAKKAGYEIINGFKSYGHLSAVWDNTWIPRTERFMSLTKLHGSISWHRDADGHVMETGGIQDRDIDHDIMMAPTEGAKDYSREPFPALMGHFRESLKNVDILLVIGFSYRDVEINKIIKRRLDEGMFLISVSPLASDDIVNISDAKHHTVDWNDSQFVVLDSKIALYDKKFGPDTIKDVCSTVGAISLYFLNDKAKKNRTVS